MQGGLDALNPVMLHPPDRQYFNPEISPESSKFILPVNPTADAGSLALYIIQ